VRASHRELLERKARLGATLSGLPPAGPSSPLG